MPDASHELAGFVIALSLIAVVYIGLVALVQADMKKLIAYSSISHMGFVTLGIFIFSAQGLEGAILQMVSHGFISAAMFLCVGVMYDRMHSRMIADYGGVANKMPVFAALFMLFAMANSGLPGTSGFVGEILTMVGVYQVSTWTAIVATSGVILSAVYMLTLYRAVVFGTISNPKLESITDLNWREVAIFAPLIAATLYMGLQPNSVFDLTAASVDQLVQTYQAAIGGAHP